MEGRVTQSVINAMERGAARRLRVVAHTLKILKEPPDLHIAYIFQIRDYSAKTWMCPASI